MRPASSAVHHFNTAVCVLSQLQDFAQDSSGIRRFSSFLLAVHEINNKSDGVADELLPNTVLVSVAAESLHHCAVRR